MVVAKNNKHYVCDSIFELYGDSFLKNFPKIMSHIARLIDKWSVILKGKNLGLYMYYTQTMENDFYDCCGVDKAELIKILNESEYVLKYPDAKNPLYNLIMVYSCFCEKYKDKIVQMYNCKADPAKYARLYLCLRIYSICQRQIFIYEPNENIYNYMLDHLSNRFDLVHVHNLYALLQDTVETNNSALEVDLSYIEDADIYQFNSKLIKRLKNYLKNIYREFDKYYRSGISVKEEGMTKINREDDKEYYVVLSNISNDIVLSMTKISQGFIQDKNIDKNFLRVACKQNKCSGDRLTSIIADIQSSKDGSAEIDRILKDILIYWIVYKNQEIEHAHSSSFIKTMAIAYNITNNNNKFIDDAKRRLGQMIIKHGKNFININTVSTVNNYKQSLYLYLIFYISANI